MDLQTQEEWELQIGLIPETKDNAYLSDAFPRETYKGKRYLLGCVLQDGPSEKSYVYYLNYDHIGKGLDLEKLREKAIEKGVMRPAIL